MNKVKILLGLLAVAASVSAAEKRDVKFTEKTYGVCAKEMSVEVKDAKISC